MIWVLLALSGGPAPVVAQESAQFSGFMERAQVLEKQVEVSCNHLDSWGNRVQSRITERVISADGAAAGLLREVQQSADSVSHVLENAEEVIARRYENVWDRRLSTVRDRVDQGLARVSQANASRAPASRSELARDEVRRAYAQFRGMQLSGPWQDPDLGIRMKNDLKSLRETKLTELKALGDLGGRIDSAIKKAAYCRCRLRSDDCSGPERMAEVTEHYKATAAMRGAEQAAYSGGGASKGE
jgi:hypothetical protein